jgi:thioredoxin reductase (NADPH)
MAGDGNPGEDAADRLGGQPAADMIELRLTGEQIDLLRREGEVRPVAGGEVLFREGDRGTDLAETMSRYLIDRIAGQPGIEVRYHTEVRSLAGSRWLERVEVEDLTTGTRETLPAAALVVLVGAEPHTGWLAGSVLLDDGGYLVTGPALGPDMRHRSPWSGRYHDPYLLETSAPGVFAAGDVRSGSVKRAAAAVGEGSIAVRFVSEHLGRRAGFAAPAPASRPA